MKNIKSLKKKPGSIIANCYVGIDLLLILFSITRKNSENKKSFLYILRDSVKINYMTPPMISKPSSGYILVMVLIMTMTLTVIVSYLFNRGRMFVPFSTAMIEKEKAKILAISGIEIGKSMIGSLKNEKSEKISSKDFAQKKDPETEESKQLLEQILPIINRQQTFELKESIDGIDGTVSICVMCEEGKIDINKIYDFENQQFVGEKNKEGNWKTTLQEIFKNIEKKTKEKKLFAAFENYLKERKIPLNDVTQLLEIKEFSFFKNQIFYQPEQSEKNLLYLTDIFTIDAEKNSLEPWLFSDSINGILGLPRAQKNDSNKRKTAVRDWLKLFSKSASWKTDWNMRLKPIYDKELQSLPEGIDSVLSKTFSPNRFSLLVLATVGSTTAHLYAIVERTVTTQKEKRMCEVMTKKLYWL